MTSVVLVRGFTVLGEFDALFALPAAQMGGDGLVLEVARQMVVIGFNGEGFANELGGHGIGIRVVPQ